MMTCQPTRGWNESAGCARRRAFAAVTLAVVAALHAFAWRLMDIPNNVTAADKRIKNRKPLIAVLISPVPRHPATRAAAPRPAANTEQAPLRPPTAPPRATIARATPPPSQPDKPSVLPNATADWNRPPKPRPSLLDDGAEERSFRYGGNADRAIAAAGSSRSPPAPEQSEFEKHAARAARADCRQAHAQMGLLALPMLARDAATGAGCHW